MRQELSDASLMTSLRAAVMPQVWTVFELNQKKKKSAMGWTERKRKPMSTDCRPVALDTLTTERRDMTLKKKTADSNVHMSKNANSAWDARNGLHENAWPKTDVTKPQKERKIYIYIYTQENTSPSYCYYNYSLLRCLYVLYRYV